MADDFDRALAALGLELFDEETQRAVDKVLDGGQVVEPGARTRMVTAAQRALRSRAIQHGPFEVLAFETRQALPVSVEALADALGTTPESILSAERGDLPLETREPEFVARWILALGLDPEIGLESAGVSVRVQHRRGAYAERREPDRTAGGGGDFLDAVASALRELDPGSQDRSA